jgi:hypothetical protein
MASIMPPLHEYQLGMMPETSPSLTATTVRAPVV